MLFSLIFLPLLTAFVNLLLKRGGVRLFSIIVSFIVLILNFKLLLSFLQGNLLEYKIFFINFENYFALSNTALILMFLSSLMIFISFLFLNIKRKGIISAIFFLEFAIMGLFSVKNGLLFYVFWEFSLLPLLYIMGVYGKDYKAGVKFFIYSFVGSILMLVAMIYQAYLNYELLGFFTFDINIWKENASAVNFTEQLLLFLAFFIAFAIKAPLFPFHTWAIKVYVNSPAIVSVMLVVFKMAPYGFLMFCLPLFPDASVYFMPLIIALCIVSIVYNALIAYKATNLKELIAYSSISHIGVMILGIFSLNQIGISGAVFYMFAHGVVTGALFLMAELLYKKYKSYELSFYHSLAKKAPLFSVFFMLILLASISLPTTLSFVGEFLVLLGTAKLNLFYAFLAGLVIILSAIYMLSVFRKIFFMQKDSFLESFSLNFKEILSLVCVVFVIFYLGIFPNFILKPLQKDANELIKTMNIRAIEQESLKFLSKMGETNAK